MKQIKIPNTELLVSNLCMGTDQIGSAIPDADAFRLLDTYLELGGNFIDSAKIYADWIPGETSVSEKTIGKWLKRGKSRDQVIVGTKGAHPHLDSMNIPRLSPDEIIGDLDASLQHLQTDYIDIYWLHRDDPSRPAGEIIETLNRGVRAGKIRYLGCSNWNVSRIIEANDYASAHGLSGFSANQNMWSFAIPNREAVLDKSLVLMGEADRSFHESSGMAAIPYSSQANGFFNGRYRQDRPLPASGSAKHVEQFYFNEENFARLNRLERKMKELSMTHSQISLGYLLSQPFPVLPIIGCKTIDQLLDSSKASIVELDTAVVKYLEYGEQQKDKRD